MSSRVEPDPPLGSPEAKLADVAYRTASADHPRLDDAMSVAVVIPSFRRPHVLVKCLGALKSQSRPPDEVIVVIRKDDLETVVALRDSNIALPLRVVQTEHPGQVHALNVGLKRTKARVIAFTDDDAAPRPAWLDQIVRSFAENYDLGAVGGRDMVPGEAELPANTARRVGRVLWFGRPVGNHHRGGPRQETHFLKGANMAFRREAIAGFDSLLRGSGAQVCNDMDASLAAWARGWTVLYDPAIVVDHWAAPRSDGARHDKTFADIRDETHNETYVLLKNLPPSRKVMAFLYGVLVGARSAPGLVLLMERLVRARGRRDAVTRFVAGMCGRSAGLATFARSR
jgi:cellulose synthase/poly-beta-1,6-N-acetylglucosamine synthase-like glycosyltransferase